MAERLVIAGAGMVPFTTGGSHASGMAESAIRNALDDSGVDAELIDQAVASRVYGDPVSGNRALARAGLTGIAISNVSNAGASGSVALFHARQALLSGEAQCVLAVGFEEARAPPAALSSRLASCSARLDWLAERTGIDDEALARIATRARAHGARSPYAVHREPLTLQGALSAPLVSGRLRRSYVSDASCGAAAVVLCTPRFAALHGLRDDVLLVAHAFESDDRADALPGDPDDPIAGSTTRRVAERAYESAGADPADIDVAEVHACCVADELIACAALGLGAQDGSVVVSPSGGMLSMGYAPGATGIGQICELVWQLRGEAGARQVAGARTALQHNGAPGGAVAVAILRRKD